ncbi:hypothetical protein, partial [Faecalibaculum rodentium]
VALAIVSFERKIVFKLKKPKEGLVEGRKEGRRTGIDLQIRRTVENTLKKGRISERDIAMYSGIPPEQVRRIRKAMA